MGRNAHLAALSAFAILILAGTELALASPQAQRPPEQNGTNGVSASMSHRGTGAVVPPPLNRIAVPLTVGECGGMGGTLMPEKTCKTGLTCETADPNGTVHHVCITKLTD